MKKSLLILVLFFSELAIAQDTVLLADYTRLLVDPSSNETIADLSSTPHASLFFRLEENESLLVTTLNEVDVWSRERYLFSFS
ncbi:MAG: hypothetical protein AAF789_08025, partial [Bacteroidota bacterium]